MLTHKQLVKKMLKKPAVQAEYHAQRQEFALLDELLRARASGVASAPRVLPAQSRKE
jgi:hypothetical protein